MNAGYILANPDAAELGQAIIEAAANDGGDPVATVIVNAHADPIWGYSMPGTMAPSWAFAHGKAFTALKFNRDTIELQYTLDILQGIWVPSGEEGWSDIDLIQAQSRYPLFCGWPGGSLLLSPHDSSVVGAIGVSNRDAIEDHKLASIRPSGWTA